MITRMDRDVGRIVDLLRARGLDQRTLVIFTSDNGPHRKEARDPEFFKSSGGLRGIKRDLYEGGIRVPMIASWPGTIPAGRVERLRRRALGLVPDVRRTRRCSGAERARRRVDRAARFAGRPQPAHEFMYWEFHERGFQQAVRMGNWKAVRLAKDKPLELYNLADDRHGDHRRGGETSGRRREDREISRDCAN